MTTKEVKGEVYHIGKLAARTQFHVLRRIAPVLAGLVPVMNIVGTMKQATKEEKAQVFGSMFQPLAQALANMNDEDLDYVINNCCMRVSRQQNDKSAPIMAPNGSTFMFSDITMDVMLVLVVEVIKENMSGFFDLLPGLLSDPESSPEAPAS